MNAAQQRLELLGLAQDHLHRGDVRSAITTFKQLVEQHPDDLRLQLKLAGLLREDGQFDAALWTYREVARHWEKSGFLLRAVTIYQQILEIDPGDVRARRKLAELYVHLHLRDRARATYRQLADAFAAQGNVPRRLAMLERIIEFRPEDAETRLDLSAALDQQGRHAEATEQLALAADVLARAGNWKRFSTVVRRYLDRVPDDVQRIAMLEQAEQHLRQAAAATTTGRSHAVDSGVVGGVAGAVEPDWSAVVPHLRPRWQADAAAGGGGIDGNETGSWSGGDGAQTPDALRRRVPPPSQHHPAKHDPPRDASTASQDRHGGTPSDATALRPPGGQGHEHGGLRTSAPSLPSTRSTSEDSRLFRVDDREARIGVPGRFALKSFGPSAEVLLTAPGHLVAAGIRARRRGDLQTALSLLHDEAASDFPLATAWESALACLALQQYGEALEHLSGLIDDSNLATGDQALAAYHLGLVAEALGDVELARSCFGRVESLAPGAANDIPLRLQRFDESQG